MTRLTIDLDEAVLLDITTPANRNFDLTLDTHRNLTGENFKCQVKNTAGVTVLELTLNAGISISGTSVTLTRTYQQMAIPTGVYSYDLVEIKDGRYDNLVKGNFTVVPSYTL